MRAGCVSATIGSWSVAGSETDSDDRLRQMRKGLAMGVGEMFRGRGGSLGFSTLGRTSLFSFLSLVIHFGMDDLSALHCRASVHSENMGICIQAKIVEDIYPYISEHSFGVCAKSYISRSFV